MVTCGFFNSVYGDRKYDADQMSDFYTGIVTQGVFQHVDNGLEVTAGTGLTVSVNTGRAIIQNKWIKNDTPLVLQLADAPSTYSRFDIVVLKYDASNRNVQIIVKTGTPVGSPVVPELVREGGIYEMCLAVIDVEAGATSVTVTDTRSDTTVCGWASVAQETSGEVDQMLDDLKTGYDGTTYSTPAAEVQGSDQKLQNQVDGLNQKIEYVHFTNRIKSANTLKGYYQWNGTIDTSTQWNRVNVPVDAGERIYISLYAVPSLAVSFLNSNQEFIRVASNAEKGNHYVDVPSGENVAFVSIPVHFDDLCHVICSSDPVDDFPFAIPLTDDDSVTRASSVFGKNTDFYTKAKNAIQYKISAPDPNIYCDYKAYESPAGSFDYSGEIQIKTGSLSSGGWGVGFLEGKSISFANDVSFTVISYEQEKNCALAMAANNKLYVVTARDVTELTTFAGASNLFQRPITAKISGSVINFYKYGTSTLITSIDLNDYGFGHPVIGFVYLNTRDYNNATLFKYFERDSFLNVNKSELDDISDSLRGGLQPYSSADGYMQASGNVVVYPGSDDTIYKYKLSSETKIYFTCPQLNFTPVSENPWCVLWFVKDGSLMTSEYIALDSLYKSWTNYEISVPAGAEEVWAIRNASIRTQSGDTKIEEFVAAKISILQNTVESSPMAFYGPYTWAKRVMGIRILADAQGCYFVPFNALGLGVSRMNGANGNDYIADQIHPTALGGYNIACGVWSYIRHIPTWHTSVPSQYEALDGTQWNGKKWYAYGTSLSTETYGKYANHVASMSGMTLSNKALPGAALVTNRNMYNALLDMEDGKLEADLITIEVGANDIGVLGNPWSIDTNEFYGALNHCIKAMFDAGVQAQIVIMASFAPRYNHLDPTDKYDVDMLIVP